MTFNGPIGDLIKFSIGGGWGSENEKSGYSKVAVIRGTDIPKVAIGDLSTVPHRFESNKKLANRLLEAGDVVLETAGGSSAKGQYTGRTLLITEEMLNSLGPTICASFCKRLELNTDIVDPGYFYWYMQDLYFSGRVAIYDSQSTGISNFQFSSFLESEILELPDLAAQKTLAKSLSKINSLIRLKFENAQVLEQIAQTIFKSWFIDFDPVKAKMAGKKPVGMDNATAALFPDSMEDSELGPIPTYWAKTAVGEVLAKQRPGKLYDQKTTRPTGKIPVLDQGRSGVVGYHDDEPGYVASPDNPVVVFANHTCSLRFISYPFSVIQNVFPILGNEISTYWLYFALQGKQNFDSYKGHWPDLVIKSIVRPTSEVAEAFEHAVSPLMKQVWNFEKQIQILTEIRDSLLPRLISGELQVPEEMLVS
jgi:type I restriction enzyme S subunit